MRIETELVRGERPCIIYMHRKYSEVVNFVPNFPATQYRPSSREPVNNNKLSPAENGRPSYSPNIVPQSQFQPLTKQPEGEIEPQRIPSTSFQHRDR